MIDFIFGLAVGVFVAMGALGMAIGLAAMWVRKALGRMM